MAITVDWPTKVINVPQADLTDLGGDVYELDMDVFRLALKDLEDDDGMPFLDTHEHTAEKTIAGFTLARVVEIINGYTVTFENGSYRVNLVGANTNLTDVLNLNTVQVIPSNSAGLISASNAELAQEVWEYIVSGTSAEQRLVLIQNNTSDMIDLLCNNADIVVNGNGSRTVTIYEDDGITIRAQVTISADGLTRTRDI